MGYLFHFGPVLEHGLKARPMCLVIRWCPAWFSDAIWKPNIPPSHTFWLFEYRTRPVFGSLLCDEQECNLLFQVLKFREKDGYFGQSAAVRDTKPPHVIYRIGQVLHSTFKAFLPLIKPGKYNMFYSGGSNTKLFKHIQMQRSHSLGYASQTKSA